MRKRDTLAFVALTLVGCGEKPKVKLLFKETNTCHIGSIDLPKIDTRWKLAKVGDCPEDHISLNGSRMGVGKSFYLSTERGVIIRCEINQDGPAIADLRTACTASLDPAIAQMKEPRK